MNTNINMGLKARKLTGLIAKIFSPGYSTCGCCGRPWSICKGHDTPISKNSSCFPLCEDCWKEMSVEERLPYYSDLYKIWRESSKDDNGSPWDVSWEMTKANVLEGR